jgi:hypothetical protein
MRNAFKLHNNPDEETRKQTFEQGYSWDLRKDALWSRINIK